MQGKELNLIYTPQNAIPPMIQVQIKTAKIHLKVTVYKIKFHLMQAENFGIIRCVLQSHCTQVIPHYMKASALGGYLNVFILWECHYGLRSF